MRLGPGPLHRRHQALIMAEDGDGRAQVVIALGFGDQLEGRKQQRGALFFLHQRLEALQAAARHGQAIVAAVLEPGLLHQLEQDEGIAGGARVDREGLAAEVLDIGDFRHRHQVQETVVAAHDRDQVGFRGGLRLALAFVVGNRVVDRGHGDVELALDGVAELEVGARRGRQVHGDAVLLEEALLLRHPDRPIAAAGKHDDLDRLCGSAPVRRRV